MEPRKMPIKVLLTVDLYSADSTARSKFDAEMRARKWTKHFATTTTWTARFEPGGTSKAAVLVTKQDVADAASAAGISSWDAICLPSTDAPVKF